MTHLVTNSVHYIHVVRAPVQLEFPMLTFPLLLEERFRNLDDRMIAHELSHDMQLSMKL